MTGGYDGSMDENREDDVVYYSGYKGQETPRAILVEGKEVAVEKVLSRKRVIDPDTGKMVDLFICQVAGRTVEIRKDEAGRSEIFYRQSLT